MKEEDDGEEQLLRKVALQSAKSIFLARLRAEDELLRTKEELWKQSEWLRVTLASIGDAVITTDTEGMVLSLNAIAESLTGWTQQEGQGRPLEEVFRIINEENRQPVENPVERALTEGRIVGLANHTILIARDGTRMSIDESAAPIRDNKGNIYGVVLIFRSIAERKQAEKALRESERELADFFENASVGLHWVGEDGTILRVNQAELSLLGYQHEEYVGHNIAKFHVDEKVIADILHRLSVGETLRDYESRMRCKDGSIKHVLIDSSVLWEDGKFIHTRCFTRDITERKRAELRLAVQNGVSHSLAESNSLHEAAPKILHSICKHLEWHVGALWRVDENGKVIHCVEVYHQPDIKVTQFETVSRECAFEQGIGLPGRVWESGKSIWIGDVVRDNNFPRAAVAAAEGLHGAFGFPIILNEEVLGVMEFFSHEIRRPEPELLEMMTALGSQIGQFIDRKRAERALRASEARKTAILNTSLDSIITCDHTGVVLEFNPAAEQTFGFHRADVLGLDMADLIIPLRLRKRHRQALEHYLITGEGTILNRRIEMTALRADGSEFPVELAITRIPGEGLPLFTAYIRDITERKLADEALRESESRFRQLADALPQIVWTARPDGFIDYYNERWYEYTGFPRGDYGDQSWKPILHPDDVQRCVDTYYNCVRTGSLYQIEYRFKDRRTGGYRWFLGRAYPVRDGQGGIVRWIGTCTDIDDTKRNEESTRFLADASAALAELTDYESTLQKVAALAIPFFADWCAVDMKESDGSLRRLAVTHSDPAKMQLAHELFRRYPPRVDDPHGIMKVLRTGMPDWVESIPDVLLAESAQDEEHLQIMRKLGLKSYICVPLKTRGKTLGVMTFVTAESGRIYNADDLQAAKDLAHRAVIAIENASLLSTLKESDKRKDEFLAILAHELRNPLAPIRNAIQILRAKGPDVPELQLARDVIDRQVEQMTRLVDDLLDVSRITRGKIELRKQRVELRSVLNDAIESSRPLIEQWGHTLKVEIPSEPIILNADPIRLAQVLLNLLNNAAKYTEQGGHIWLAAERKGEQVVVRVKDTGVGIPTGMLPHIFEMFTQVDRTIERSQGGLGIGLTLAQRLVVMHGGELEAKSQGLEQGSEFIVRLPVAEDKDRNVWQDSAMDKPMPVTQRRILIVDDNQDSAESLAVFLKIMGHEVSVAYDGLAAVKEAEVFQPGIILLDIGLPKLNGYEVARRIRELYGDHVILIALTGWGQQEDRRRSKEAGFNHHLTKPVEFDDLNKLLTDVNPHDLSNN